MGNALVSDAEIEEGFNRYLKTLPPINSKDVIEAEKEWFENEVTKFKWLEKAKKELLNESDFQDIGGKKFIKKTGAKKLASAFHISTEILDVREVIHDWGNNAQYITSNRNRNIPETGIGKEIIVIVKARAVKKALIKKDNQTIELELDSCEAMASCSNYELAQKKGQDYNYHNILATAETRATNRAILNLLGGDVSAEEITYDSDQVTADTDL